MSSSIPNRTRVFSSSSFKHTPLEHVRTILVRFVQGLFAAAPPGEYRWSPHGHSEIIIRDENVLRAEEIGNRPAVNFTRGSIQFASVGMDDLEGYKFRDGQKTKGILVPGVHTINVSSRSDLEADNLAWVIAEHIWLLRDMLMKEGFFEIGRSIVIAAPSSPGSIIQADNGDEWYVSAISVPWQFARQSAFTPLGNTIVQSIETSLALNQPKHVESIGWPDGGFELPFNIQEYPPEAFSQASDAHGGTPDPGGAKSNPLTRQPHPLDPSKTVTVRTVTPHRAGLRGRTIAPSGLPIDGAYKRK